MALTLSELNSVSHEYFDDTIIQEVYDEIPFLALLKSKKKINTDGGTQIQFPLRYKALGTYQTTSPRSQIVFQSEETRTAGVVDWGFVTATTMMHWDEKVKNSGKGKIIDLMKDKSMELKDEFYEGFSDDIWSTTARPTNGIERINTIVDSADTYAGIAVADDANWKAVEDSTNTTLTLRLLQGLRNDATFGKSKPTYHFTTRDLLSKYESILQPHVRYDSSDVKRALDLGFEAVSFYGAAVMADPHITANYWFGLDLDNWELRTHPDYAFTVSEWKEMHQAGFPHAVSKIMTATCQLVCKLRKTNFKCTALDADL